MRQKSKLDSVFNQEITPLFQYADTWSDYDIWGFDKRDDTSSSNLIDNSPHADLIDENDKEEDEEAEEEALYIIDGGLSVPVQQLYQSPLKSRLKQKSTKRKLGSM